ncbi:MAG: MarR family transcriptional regulator [Planctomycetes bacterium]|nr:MarR family transcriptional regulator [Planctomycetota bacterium]
MAAPVSISDQALVSIRRIIRAIDLQSRRLAQACGLTGPQLLLLQRLQAQPAQATGELAEAIGLSLATVSEILDRLEKRSLVTRARSTKDSRRVLVSITPAGSAALATAPPLIQVRFRDEFENLRDWEQSQILACLQRVAAMMDRDDLDAAPILVSGPIPAQEPGSPAAALDRPETRDAPKH